MGIGLVLIVWAVVGTILPPSAQPSPAVQQHYSPEAFGMAPAAILVANAFPFARRVWGGAVLA